MGRYRRGHRHRKSRGQNRKQNQNGDDGAESLSSYTYSPQLGEADWILVEKYLLEYRSRAYGIHYSKEGLSRCHQHQPLNVPIHKFLPLTSEMCKRPYIDLPDTLSPKERHKVHAMCACLDLFHAGAGGDNAGTNTKDEGAAINDSAVNNGTSTSTLNKRRIVISIYADGLKFVPDLEPSYARGGRQSFPSRICQPWYFKAKSSTTNNSTEQCQRLQTIELEKKKIRQFANLPEQSLRTSDGSDQSFCDSLDFNVLDSLDLSMVPSPEETSWVLVDTVDKLKLCADELVYGVGTSGDDKARSPKIHELAFDLEMHNIGGGSGGIRTCLIQITSDVATIVYDEHSKSSKEVYKDYVIDPLAPGVWSAILTFLGPIFSNPEIVKIGHGIGGMDTSSLHRDFGILIVNAFDTYEASTILSSGKGGMGLAMLCRHYGLPSWEHYKRLKHQYQRSDWSKRPLDNDALEYGRYDIRYLVALRKLLLRDLAKLDMIGSGYLRFGSSIEDDSGVESTPASKEEGTQNLHSFESRLDSTTSSSVSSFSENEFNTTATSGNSLNQFKDVEGDVVESKLMKLGNCAGDVIVDSVDSQGEPSLPSSSIKSIITASEFPCYHHLMKAISISQKRCLKLWTGEDDEPILKNRALLTMIKHAANEKGHGKHWSDGNMQLYKQLTEWRVNVAQQELNSVSGVCSLDFLVHVAYKLTKNRCEMRRYSYVLPVLLEDESLPYCDELCELVTSSDVFQRQGQRMDVMDVVFYSNDEDNCEKKQERQKQLFKLLFASTVIGVTFLAITRSRRR
ncbi:hypothetical protein ACHAXR_005336 [Thalassiosira sp. AJA248-18]